MISIEKLRYPLLIAHRGYRANYPENTLAAFRPAVDAGVQMVELDVTLTKDRKVVVIHDDTLDRTTDGHGRVCDFTLAELKQLDAGSWFDACFAEERIPTLAEVLDTVLPHVMVNIEIKPEAFESHAPADAIEHLVTELVWERSAQKAVLISSFEHRVLERISFFPDAPALGVLTENVNAEAIIPLCRSIRAFSWNPDCLCADRQQINRMHQAGCRVFPYTVNQKKEIEKLLEMGADGVFTDDPLLMGPLL
ncbi:MAG: glycerophosphodiester phosphodiesterase [Desulfococcaceae bacterium]